jgi:hypothetical protein
MGKLERQAETSRAVIRLFDREDISDTYSCEFTTSLTLNAAPDHCEILEKLSSDVRDKFAMTTTTETREISHAGSS